MKTIFDTPRRTWWLGVSGLAGALLFAVGDQCFSFAPIAGAGFDAKLKAIATAAPTSLALFGAGLAPIAAILVLAGLVHVYAHIRARQPRLAALVWIGLAVCILAGASFHSLWGAKVLVLKAGAVAAPAATTGLTTLYAQLHDYANGIYVIAEWTGYPAILVLGILIALGRSDYPRWFCLLIPAIPFLLMQALTPWVPAPFGSVIGGSAPNLAFALFFAVSLALTRPRGAAVSPSAAVQR